MAIPEDISYTAEHEWIRFDKDIATVGITSYAAEALGDVVYVELPAVGARVRMGEPCGELESTKSVSELFAPLTGLVVEVNEAVASSPSVVTDDPFRGGWLFRVSVDEGEPGDLLDAPAYQALVEGA